MEFVDGLKKVREWFVENWCNIGQSSKRKYKHGKSSNFSSL